MIGGGGGGWPKATARGRVREGNVPPPAQSAKLKLPPFYKVNGKLKRGPLQHYASVRFSMINIFCLIICTCSCCVRVAPSMEKKNFLFRSGGGGGGGRLPPLPTT